MTAIKSVQVTFENTPNPATLKFNFSEAVTHTSCEFPDVSSTDHSPLAAKIFGFPWVSAVYISETFMTVTKQDWVDWKVLSHPLAGLIAEHINSGNAIFITRSIDPEIHENDTPVVKQIKKVLREEIKPVVALDGGDVEFAKFENQILYIQMKGACSGCPSSQATLKEGIEVRLKQAIPEIQSVEAI